MMTYGAQALLRGSGMGKRANLGALNKNMTKKVFSSSAGALRGAEYYLSQTKKYLKISCGVLFSDSGIVSCILLSLKGLLR